MVTKAQSAAPRLCASTYRETCIGSNRTNTPSLEQFISLRRVRSYSQDFHFPRMAAICATVSR